MTTKTENEQISTTRTVKDIVVRWRMYDGSEGEASFPLTQEGDLKLKHHVAMLRETQEPVIVFRTTATTTTEELIRQGV